METKEKKKVQSIAAGEVVLIKYTSEEKPCDRCICLLLNPINPINGKGCDKLQTVFAIDLDKEAFLPEGKVADFCTGIIEHIKDRKRKDWYFAKVREILGLKED